MSVPLPTVPDDQEGGDASPVDVEISQAKHEAADIIDRARRQAEEIIAEARAGSAASSPLAALGDNAEEIIGQVRKLIKKQRELQDERQQMLTEIEELKAERDELVQRLTDAVVRMEELAAMADGSESTAEWATPPSPTPPPPPAPEPEPIVSAPAAEVEEKPEDTSLAARLGRAEREEDTSLAARLQQAERERAEESSDGGPVPGETHTDDEEQFTVGADGRSFYSRHSAKLPRLEGDGGRSVLSAVGDMRPDSEPKGRKGRRRKKG